LKKKKNQTQNKKTEKEEEGRNVLDKRKDQMKNGDLFKKKGKATGKKDDDDLNKINMDAFQNTEKSEKSPST